MSVVAVTLYSGSMRSILKSPMIKVSRFSCKEMSSIVFEIISRKLSLTIPNFIFKKRRKTR